MTFREVADQYLAAVAEDAKANDISERWIDQQRANVALLKEIVRESTPVLEVGFDACSAVRTALAQIPIHWKKSFPELQLDTAIQMAEQQGLRTVTATT